MSSFLSAAPMPVNSAPESLTVARVERLGRIPGTHALGPAASELALLHIADEPVCVTERDRKTVGLAAVVARSDGDAV